MAKCTVSPWGFLLLGFGLLALPFSWVLAMVTAAAVHELGHCAALFALEIPIYSVHIGPFGAKIETGPMEPGQELRCALAGPGLGLMLCLFWRWIPKCAGFALAQSLFNLLPVWPLDGGRALRALREVIGPRFGKSRRFLLDRRMPPCYNNTKNKEDFPHGKRRIAER